VSPKRFEVLDHTADIGLIIYGRDLKALFENGGEALFHLITDLKRVRGRVEKRVVIREKELKLLMVAWLNELLYFHDTQNLLFSEFEVGSVGNDGLSALAKGEPFQEGTHVIKTQVKAVTYHQVEVRKENRGWRAQVILDL
jgi:SHS2 domain-containing protein